MTQHTQLPWRLAENGERIAFAECHVTGANGRPVATTIYPLAKSDWRSEDEANARFIVQACNAYDTLLAALKELLEESYGEDSDGIRLARAAIAKATPQAR